MAGKREVHVAGREGARFIGPESLSYAWREYASFGWRESTSCASFGWRESVAYVTCGGKTKLNLQLPLPGEGGHRVSRWISIIHTENRFLAGKNNKRGS